MRFLENFHLDRLSFWLGFLLSAILWWLMGRLRHTVPQLKERAGQISQQAHGGARSQTELQLRNLALQRAQTSHLASPLFPLDDILVPPRLVAPPPPENPGGTPLHEDITSATIPFLQDSTELAATYHAPTLSIEEALSQGANLVITGALGSGKSVAIASLASRLARRETQQVRFLPLVLHAADLALPPGKEAPLLAPLLSCLATSSANPRQQSRMERLITDAFSTGQAILLLDGLDEMPPISFDVVVEYLAALLEAHPLARILTTASPEYLGKLPEAGFIPIPIAAWTIEQASLLLDRWQVAWQDYLVEIGKSGRVDLELVKAWLVRDQRYPDPLELTLAVWSAYSGDAASPGAGASIETHLLRLLPDFEKERAAAEQLALAMLVSEQTPLEKNASGLDDALEQFIETTRQPHNPADRGVAADTLPRLTKTSRAIAPLLEHGILSAYADGRLAFSHPSYCAFLAGSLLARLAPWLDGAKLAAWQNHLHWSTKSEALKFLVCQEAGVQWAEQLAASSQAPLHEELLSLARWIPNASKAPAWQNPVLRRLVGLIQDRRLPFVLAARAMLAIGKADLPGANVLFKQIAQEADSRRKALALLCGGMLSSPIDTEVLANALNDSTPLVYQSACLALVAVRSREAIDLVGYALLHGSEELRRAAAEALANDVEEGHPLLIEALSLEDILVRRAVIYALLRIRQAWAIEHLRKLQLDDPQWVVKNAADQALEELALPNPRIPSPAPPLSETGWLIAFAGERGMGIAPGKGAREMLTLALQEGSEDQRMAALQCARQTGAMYAWNLAQQLLVNGRGEVQDAAYETLWQLRRCSSEVKYR